MSDLSILDGIIAEADASRERRILLPVPLESRHVSLLCRTVTSEEVGASIRLGERLAPKNNARAKLLHCKNILAVATVEIWRNDEPVCGSDGEPINFGDDELLKRAKVADKLDAVPKIVGRDGDIIVMGDALLEQSGYTSEGYQLPDTESPI